MTVNHVFLMVSHVKMPAMRSFYQSILKPLGYTEMITVSESYIGFGSDYPYFWLKSLPEGKESVPTHIALDAPGKSEVANLNFSLSNDFFCQIKKLLTNFIRSLWGQVDWIMESLELGLRWADNLTMQLLSWIQMETISRLWMWRSDRYELLFEVRLSIGSENSYFQGSENRWSLWN